MIVKLRIPKQLENLAFSKPKSQIFKLFGYSQEGEEQFLIESQKLLA